MGTGGTDLPDLEAYASQAEVAAFKALQSAAQNCQASAGPRRSGGKGPREHLEEARDLLAAETQRRHFFAMLALNAVSRALVNHQGRREDREKLGKEVLPAVRDVVVWRCQLRRPEALGNRAAFLEILADAHGGELEPMLESQLLNAHHKAIGERIPGAFLSNAERGDMMQARAWPRHRRQAPLPHRPRTRQAPSRTWSAARQAPPPPGIPLTPLWPGPGVPCGMPFWPMPPDAWALQPGHWHEWLGQDGWCGQGACPPPPQPPPGITWPSPCGGASAGGANAGAGAPAKTVPSATARDGDCGSYATGTGVRDWYPNSWSSEGACRTSGGEEEGGGASASGASASVETPTTTVPSATATDDDCARATAADDDCASDATGAGWGDWWERWEWSKERGRWTSGEEEGGGGGSEEELGSDTSSLMVPKRPHTCPCPSVREEPEEAASPGASCGKGILVVSEVNYTLIWRIYHDESDVTIKHKDERIVGLEWHRLTTGNEMYIRPGVVDLVRRWLNDELTTLALVSCMTEKHCVPTARLLLQLALPGSTWRVEGGLDGDWIKGDREFRIEGATLFGYGERGLPLQGGWVGSKKCTVEWERVIYHGELTEDGYLKWTWGKGGSTHWTRRDPMRVLVRSGNNKRVCVISHEIAIKMRGPDGTYQKDPGAIWSRVKEAGCGAFSAADTVFLDPTKEAYPEGYHSNVIPMPWSKPEHDGGIAESLGRYVASAAKRCSKGALESASRTGGIFPQFPHLRQLINRFACDSVPAVMAERPFEALQG